MGQEHFWWRELCAGSVWGQEKLAVLKATKDDGAGVKRGGWRGDPPGWTSPELPSKDLA